MPAAQQTIAPTTFGATSTTDDVLEGVNLRGKRVLVTGVSAGLGVETARALVAHGANVVGAARDLTKAKAATAGVQAAAKNGGGFELVELDLASLDSVRVCADALVDNGKLFDRVIANAGVMACPLGKSADGFETRIRNQRSRPFRAGQPHRFVDEAGLAAGQSVVGRPSLFRRRS